MEKFQLSKSRMDVVDTEMKGQRSKMTEQQQYDEEDKDLNHIKPNPTFNINDKVIL